MGAYLNQGATGGELHLQRLRGGGRLPRVSRRGGQLLIGAATY